VDGRGGSATDGHSPVLIGRVPRVNLEFEISDLKFEIAPLLNPAKNSGPGRMKGG
jgi:hypothetical protein